MSIDVPTQAERVLDYIDKFGSISRLEAFHDIGVANLTAVISDIRRQYGYDYIVTNEIATKNRYGQKITYAIYSFGNLGR